MARRSRSPLATSSATVVHARALGASGRRMVERELTWDRYVDRLASIVQIAAVA